MFRKRADKKKHIKFAPLKQFGDSAKTVLVPQREREKKRKRNK